MTSRTKLIASLAGAAGGAVLLLFAVACRRADPGSFATPEEAVAAVASVAGTGDEKRVEEIFGPGSMELFRSGDPEEDRKAALKVKELIAAKVGFDELDANTRVALFGEKAWPFPIPLVRKDGRWRFDTEAGRTELLNRRVGYNELSTLNSLHEYVNAQREYAAEGRDGNPRAYAQRFLSSEGKQDGLYWPAAEGEPESPLGDLLADASVDASKGPQPFNGYHYRILTGQGKNAPGGEMSYLDSKGLMSRGFAAVAWPAKHGNSGVMTFLVNERGIVYQKDLGAETGTVAAAIQSFDPDSSWEVTGDSLAEVEDEGAAEAGEAPTQ
jgi:DUF2950 family protein